jgi:hypothetical protein
VEVQDRPVGEFPFGDRMNFFKVVVRSPNVPLFKNSALGKSRLDVSGILTEGFPVSDS